MSTPNVIQIEDTILYKKIVANNPTENQQYWGLVSLLYLRILLTLDQCHDFLEKANRNKWSNTKTYRRQSTFGVSTVPISKTTAIRKTDRRTTPPIRFVPGPDIKKQKDTPLTKAHKKIMENFVNDAKWIINLTQDQALQVKLNTGTTKYYNLINDFDKVKSTDKIKDIIDMILTELNISNVNIYDSLRRALQGTGIEWSCSGFSSYILKALSGGKYNGSNRVIIGVDATFKNLNFSQILMNICDVLSRGDKLTIVNTASSKYDAAGESGIIKHIKNMALYGGATPNYIEPVDNYNLKLMLGTETVIDIIYKRVPSTTGSSSNSPDVWKLQINKFFSENSFTPPLIDISTQITDKSPHNSVNYLTSNFEPDDNIFLYKTLGDFGQILSFAGEYKHNYNNTPGEIKPVGMFLTFDYVASVISSFFIQGTVLEDLSNTINPISIYNYTKSELDATASLLVLAQTDIGQAANILTGMPTGMQTPFGKIKKQGKNLGKDKDQKQDQKQYNNQDKKLKEKLKSVGIRVTKEIKGKRVKLTHTELLKKIESFKKLQVKAKDKGVKITYINKNGQRVHKTTKRLVSELERLKQKKQNKKSLKNEFGKVDSKAPPNVINKKLYIRIKEKIRKDVNKKKRRWGAYDSSRLVKLYKADGGKYKNSVKYDNKLNKWHQEKWVDACAWPKKKSCGRTQKDIKNKVTYCRPSVIVNSKTPKTVQELSKKEIKNRCNKKKKSPLKYVR